MRSKAQEDRCIVAAVGLRRQQRLAVMLGMVTIAPKARILELHTDPDLGHSALLLAWASRRGRVVSVDDAPRVTDRARQAQALWTGDPQVGFHTGPLAEGWAAGAPYDLIVSNVLFGWLPHPWLDQCAPGGSIVMPLEHEDPRPCLFLSARVDEQHRPTDPIVLVESDPHPHHSRYDATAAVDLRREDDGYTVTTQLTADRYA